MDDFSQLTASAAAKLLGEGRLSSEELVESCLARIAAREPEIGAWHYLDRDHALAQARAADAAHQAGRPEGPLHG
ncbi:MAG: amidase family protein, partial [Alphaproteobacteria bacterium]